MERKLSFMRLVTTIFAALGFALSLAGPAAAANFGFVR
jgi:hypothetical protein